MKYLKILVLIIIGSFIGCSTTLKTNSPTQLGKRAIETRYIDSNFDIAYKSATHAFFALGFTIKHSEKAAGIIMGTNETSNSEGRAGKTAAYGLGYGLGWIIPGAGLLGNAGELIDTSNHRKEITLFLDKGVNDKRTTMRIQMIINGEPQIDPKTVDSIWIVTQREAMVTSGVNVPDDIENKFKNLNNSSSNKKEKHE
jgi:hypothetical protein